LAIFVVTRDNREPATPQRDIIALIFTLLVRLGECMDSEDKVERSRTARYYHPSLRLKHYDYRQAGAYFVTICTLDRRCTLGKIVNEQVALSAAGELVQSSWLNLPSGFPGVELDACVIMPNHVHGVLVLPDRAGTGLSGRAPTLGQIIRQFKGAACYLARRRDAPDFAWQRNYYEHVIRNEGELDRTRRYVVENPQKWELDRENPVVATPAAKSC
jgi:REP element-mobilizing transposase RayT